MPVQFLQKAATVTVTRAIGSLLVVSEAWDVKIVHVQWASSAAAGNRRYALEFVAGLVVARTLYHPVVTAASKTVEGDTYDGLRASASYARPGIDASYLLPWTMLTLQSGHVITAKDYASIDPTVDAVTLTLTFDRYQFVADPIPVPEPVVHPFE